MHKSNTHCAFDFFLFKCSTLLHVTGAIAAFYIVIKLSRGAIRKKNVLSQNHFKGIDVIANEDHPLL